MPTTPPTVVLSNVPWDAFLALVEGNDDHGGRFAYDRGTLEIMSPSGTHEKVKRLIGRLIETLTLLLDQDVASFGSTTLLAHAAERGLEPDECYYLRHEPDVRGKGNLDLVIDPPPDLVVEVDVSRSSVPKFPIYDSLRVPEVWRYDGTELVVHLRKADAEGGGYAPSAQSLAFPDLDLARFAGFVARWETASENSIVREFMAWVTANAERSGSGDGESTD